MLIHCLRSTVGSVADKPHTSQCLVVLKNHQFIIFKSNTKRVRKILWHCPFKMFYLMLRGVCECFVFHCILLSCVGVVVQHWPIFYTANLVRNPHRYGNRGGRGGGDGVGAVGRVWKNMPNHILDWNTFTTTLKKEIKKDLNTFKAKLF